MIPGRLWQGNAMSVPVLGGVLTAVAWTSGYRSFDTLIHSLIRYRR